MSSPLASLSSCGHLTARGKRANILTSWYTDHHQYHTTELDTLRAPQRSRQRSVTSVTFRKEAHRAVLIMRPY